MNEKNNYGKIIAITLAVITAASAISYVLYRLVRNLLSFCSCYDEDEDADLLDFDELDEELEEEPLDEADEDTALPDAE